MIELAKFKGLTAVNKEQNIEFPIFMMAIVEGAPGRYFIQCIDRNYEYEAKIGTDKGWALKNNAGDIISPEDFQNLSVATDGGSQIFHAHQIMFEEDRMNVGYEYTITCSINCDKRDNRSIHRRFTLRKQIIRYDWILERDDLMDLTIAPQLLESKIRQEIGDY